MAYNKTVMFFFQKPENYYRQDFVRKIRAEKNGFEYLTLQELQAIIKKCQELGWI